jgi:hypothetical protein
MIRHFFYVQWRELLKILMRYGIVKRMYARWRLREVSVDVRSSADAEHDLVRLGRPIIPVLVGRLHDGYSEVRTTSLRILDAIDRERAWTEARRLATDEDPRVAALARRLVRRGEAADGEAS